jgi:hypothetical protein
MRVLGSSRRGSSDAQIRYFAPLLKARRRLEEEFHLESRLDTFDAERLKLQVANSLTAFARELCPHSAPDRRAMEAELFDASEAFFAALQRVGAAAENWRDGSDSRRFELWREWIREVDSLFRAADRSWIAAAPLIATSAGGDEKRRRLWGGSAVFVALSVTSSGFFG